MSKKDSIKPWDDCRTQVVKAVIKSSNVQEAVDKVSKIRGGTTSYYALKGAWARWRSIGLTPTDRLSDAFTGKRAKGGSSKDEKSWSDKQLRAAKDVLKKHAAVKQAMPEISQALGFKVTEKALAKELELAKEPTAEFFLADIPEEMSPEEFSMAKVAEHDYKSKMRELRRSVKTLAQQLKASEERHDFLDALNNNSRSRPIPISKSKTKKKGRILEATAVALASDWHIEERVDPGTVNGRNEYTLDVAWARAKRFFEGIAWNLEHHRSGVNPIEIEKLVLWLGGDLITGYIHEELEESNFLSPTEASLVMTDMFYSGITYLRKEFPDMKFEIPCNYGNHGRTTKKRRIKTGAKNSFEWLAYKFLEKRFDDDDNVKFHIAGGDHIYLDIYDTRTRFTHGDNFSYGGGIGGLSIPVNKAVARLESFMPADLTCIGHFHQLKNFGDVIVNGSLIGYSDYAVKINAPYEEPQQAFFLISPGRGVCQFTSLWLTESGR